MYYRYGTNDVIKRSLIGFDFYQIKIKFCLDFRIKRRHNLLANLTDLFLSKDDIYS
jgi:hypothetical protein